MRVRTVLAGGGAAVVAGALVACGPTVTVSGPTGTPTTTHTRVPSASSTPASPEPKRSDQGGTLVYATAGPIATWDPQRMYVGAVVANAGRLFSRSLVQFPASNDRDEATKPVPDLATDTGRESDGGKTWSFTLKDGVRWQDGKPVTCEDLRYGVSRTFSEGNTGPLYAREYLDVPRSYDGPDGSHDQGAIDDAVTCDGKTVTYHFTKPWPDFPKAIASLRAFDPVRSDHDYGSTTAAFSDGPYKLQGGWSGQGGTFVRNPEYDSSTDGVRRARPDTIEFHSGSSPAEVVSQMSDGTGDGARTVTSSSVPASSLPGISGAVKDRVINPTTGYVEYLAVNAKTLTTKKVRRALLLATSRSAYLKGGGGAKYAVAAHSVVPPSVPGYRAVPQFARVPDSGQPAKAKALLKSAGVKLPYAIDVVAPKSVESNMKALARRWAKAGFKVKLKTLSFAEYLTQSQRPDDDADVYWASWGADWPSMSTVLPPLFDSRINLTESSKGQDVGNYSGDRVEGLFDSAAKQTDASKRQKIYRTADRKLARDLAYIPLVVDKFVLLHGSDVTHYRAGPATQDYPDLGVIGVTE